MGMGIIVDFTTLGHQGLLMNNIYTHDINTIGGGSPAQSDYPTIQNSTGIVIGGLSSPPVPNASQWVVKDITISNFEGTRTNPFYLWTMQAGGLYSNYPTNSVQNVTVKNSYFHDMPRPGIAMEAASNVTFIDNRYIVPDISMSRKAQPARFSGGRKTLISPITCLKICRTRAQTISLQSMWKAIMI